MLLHRYFGSHGFETLKEANLRTSRISSFNDSFEFLYFSEGKTTSLEMQRFLKTHFSDPVVLFDVIETNQKSVNPISDSEVKIRMSRVIPSLAHDGTKVWPDIVKQTELSLERRRQIIDQELRAICFCDASKVKRTEEILLWSHYGKKHEGIRIGFEFPQSTNAAFEVRPITYRKNRVKVSWSLEGEDPTLKALEESATVKCDVWEYEREFRLFTKTTNCEAREVKRCDSTAVVEYFLNFPKEWVKSVDFGVFCPDSDIQPIVNVLKNEYPNVRPKKAEFHDTEYALEYKSLH